MDRELVIVIIVLILLTTCFNITLLITEKVNINRLKKKYSKESAHITGHVVSVPPLSEKAFSYHKSKVAIWIISHIWGVSVTAFFLFSGLSSNISRWAHGISESILIWTALYYAVYSIINYLVDLPLSIYSGYIMKHSYGLSNQTFGKWIKDSLKALLLSIIIGSSLIWVPYYLIRTYPAFWWLYAGLLAIPFMVFMSYISPVYIDPLFNKYKDIENKELEDKIHGLLNRTTIGDCRVFQVNKSVDTKEMNAYMTGIFNTKRIVMWDTTLNNLTEREILSVTAHEMGHYIMGHVWKMIGLGGAASIFILYLIDRGAIWVLQRSGGIFGFEMLGDTASLPLLAMVGSVIMFVINPAANAYSRHNEREADTFELELTRDNFAGASSMVKLHYNSLILPEPGVVYKLWNYGHPTFKDRVEFANTYKPWEESKPLKYERYFVNHNT